jgi:hypothetical protein
MALEWPKAIGLYLDGEPIRTYKGRREREDVLLLGLYQARSPAGRAKPPEPNMRIRAPSRRRR